MLLFLSLLSGLLCLEIISTWGSSFREGGGGVLPQVSSVSFSEVGMRYMVLITVLLIGCAQQPLREQVAIWSYFLEQCKNEGIANTIDAMQGCITLKERQASNSTQVGNVLQGMGAALNPEVYQGFVNRPVQTCRTAPDYVGGYRTVCQGY
jgi:hypothetical protein